MSYEWSIDSGSREIATQLQRRNVLSDVQGVDGPFAFSEGYERLVDAQIFRVDGQGRRMAVAVTCVDRRQSPTYVRTDALPEVNVL